MPTISGKPPRTPITTAQAEAVAKELYGPTARIVDKGVPGVLDKKDRLVREEGGRTVNGAVGVKRNEEIAFRARVVTAAKDLAASGASFSGSADGDRVNQKLWTMGFGGRMQVRKFLEGGELGKPSAALRDIFDNGHQYGFECATAMMVIYHKAILDHVGDDAFDAMFTEPRNLAFFRWSIEDDDFLDVKKLVHKPTPLMPGSHYYYTNPDASPENSAFSGENVLYLGDGQFYAHGIVGSSGTYLVTEADIMDTLSALRRSGSTTKPSRVAMAMWLDGYALSKKAFPDGIPT
jgi:protein-glutamine gamma-glutamyltransferase